MQSKQLLDHKNMKLFAAQLALCLLLMHAGTAGGSPRLSWDDIPFLNATNSVSELNATLGDSTHSPVLRFRALSYLLGTYADANVPSSELTNILWSASGWIDDTDIQAEGIKANIGPGFRLTFTNDVTDWVDMMPADTNRWNKPFVWFSLSFGRKDTRSPEDVISFLQGTFPSAIESFTLCTWHEDCWVVFTRGENWDLLRLYRVQEGQMRERVLSRKTIMKEVQQPDAEVQAEGAPSD
jgi:hypothetical protein